MTSADKDVETIRRALMCDPSEQPRYVRDPALAALERLAAKLSCPEKRAS